MESLPLPPPYSSTLDERTQILAHAATTFQSVKGPAGLGEASESSIERLLNFLCYTLHIDYEVGTLETPVSLSAADANHFRTLSSIFWRYYNTLDSTTVEEGEKIHLGVYIWENVYAPAHAFSVPAEVVLSDIINFVQYQALERTCKGCIAGLMNIHGPWRLTGKLLIDQYTLIPRVVPNRAVEAALMAGLKIVHRRWFNQFDGHEYKAGKRMENGDWYTSEFSAYELSDEGERYFARWVEAREMLNKQQGEKKRAAAQPTMLVKPEPKGIFDEKSGQASPRFQTKLTPEEKMKERRRILEEPSIATMSVKREHWPISDKWSSLRLSILKWTGRFLAQLGQRLSADSAPQKNFKRDPVLDDSSNWLSVEKGAAMNRLDETLKVPLRYFRPQERAKFGSPGMGRPVSVSFPTPGLFNDVTKDLGEL